VTNFEKRSWPTFFIQIDVRTEAAIGAVTADLCLKIVKKCVRGGHAKEIEFYT